MNCYNPGQDLEKVACPEKKNCDKNYNPFCAYNTQGQFVCDKKENVESKKNMGWDYILGQDYVLAPYDNALVFDSKTIAPH